MPKQTLVEFGQSIKAKHPEYADIPDAELGQKVLAKYPQYGDMVSTDGGAADAAANPFGKAAAHPAVQMDAPVKTMGALHTAKDLGVGVAKSVGNSANNIGKMLIPDAALKAVGATPPSAAQQASYFAPQNTTQAVGKVAGDVGQFFIPGPAEEMGAAKLAPFLGKAGAKIATAALGSGAVNKAEGGSFTSGMAGGAFGSALGQGIQKVAPALAETALGVRATDRALGRTPGDAALAETRGVLPGKIAAQANGTVNKLTGQVEQALRFAPDGSLAPARGVANSFVDTAVRRNTPESIKRTTALQNVLTTKLGPDAKPVMVPKFGDVVKDTGVLDEYGQPITRTERATVGQQPAQYPETVPARTLLDLKRGIGEQSQAFNPAVKNDLADSARANIYHALDTEMDRLAPTTEGLNSRITSLIPVAQRAGATDLNASMLQRVAGRFARPTGALVGAGLGYEGGKREGGTPGAIAGALTGLVAPEILANPTVLMTGARTANAAGPALGKLANASAQEYLRRRP